VACQQFRLIFHHFCELAFQAFGNASIKAPAGAFYYPENGENSMREVCQAINRMLG
jgi:hypothetical protein